MSQMGVSPDHPGTPPSRAGLVVLAMIVLGVAVWMYSQRPSTSPAGTATAPLPASLPADLQGFRADAWFLPDDDLLGFVEVPAGPFLMGSDPATDPQAFENERWSGTALQGTVEVPTFFIGRYEVTVAQFAIFVDATGFRVSEQTLQAPPSHPVSSVSWPDALAYCRWLDATLRESAAAPPALNRVLRDGWRVTLPTEAEWEKAARGADARNYPWGSEPRRDRANYQGQGTTPVGTYSCPECPFGLLDMSGNVWELTRSPYQPYPYDSTDDGNDLDAPALWVMRGGSFAEPEQNVRAATRGGSDPGARRPFIGFRVVISPP